MNNKNVKDYLKLENPVYQNVRMNNKKKLINYIILFLILIFALIILFFLYYFQKYKKNIKKNKTRYDIDFNYVDYENNIITTNMINNSGWQLVGNQPYFINGLIRKFKTQNCLEVGVANGGSSVLILNAIKDIPDSSLISLDLNTQLYYDQSKKTGYIVNQYFPELKKNGNY